MDQEGFRAFYESTARPLWAYLESASGNAALADDLMQEAYLKLMTANLPDSVNEAHRKHYLFRVATNLLRDHYRRKRITGELPLEELPAPDLASAQESKHLIDAALSQLRVRDRELLWLAHVEGASHREIAAVTGYTEMSVRPLLSQAKKRIAAALTKLLGRE